MFLLFDEAGKLMAGRILSEAEASAQVELDSGKRLKVKAAHQLLRFDKPTPGVLLAAAAELAPQIEAALAWEFAPETEFGFADLAAEYFGGEPSVTQQTAALMALQEAPHYFRRAGKGRFRKASADVVQQALAAIEKKRAQQAQIDAWTAELAAGRCPQPIAEQLFKILFRPDKNAPEYKAVVHAAHATQRAPLSLLQAAGAIASPYQFHWQRFLFEHFPRGTAFPPLVAPALPADLPLAEGVQAFSIDDSQTTEIDDALSVQGLGSGTVTVGIHIAAPGLAVAPGDALDTLARQRLSTVYMPGHKITMLPDAVVDAYTLSEGAPVPAVSLYVRFDEATLALQDHQTRIERVAISHNLRHDQLDEVLTAEWMGGANWGPGAAALSPEALHALAPLRPPLAFLLRLAQHLKTQREQVRGKPETRSRPDYSFRLLDAGAGEPSGDEQVQITTRARGATLDLIVAEAMILANSTWGEWLHSLGVPAIYRSQASLAPGIKVRMGTKSLPHAGLGVKSYAWSTSPLRRYTDLVNQWQIIAAAQHGQTAALAAPFKPKDTELMAVVSAFDAAYTAYGQHQASMERFWTLRWLQQHGVTELDATVIKDQPGGAWLVRADTLPLVFPVLGNVALGRGAHVRVALGRIDLMALDVGGTVLERLDDSLNLIDTSALDSDDDADGADAAPPAATPIALALDLEQASDAQGESANPDNPAP